MYPTKNRPLLGLTASLLALCFSPPTPVCATTSAGLPPDDSIVQRTEQFDGSMNMVVVQGDRIDRLVIPVLNHHSYETVAAGDYNAQILVFDDHPRAVRILTLDNTSATLNLRDPASSAATSVMLMRPSWNKFAYTGTYYQDSGIMNSTTVRKSMYPMTMLGRVRLTRT